LIDYQEYSRQNNGFRYILAVVDSFSRYAYTVPLRSKHADVTANALESIIETMQFPPSIFVSDKVFIYLS